MGRTPKPQGTVKKRTRTAEAAAPEIPVPLQTRLDALDRIVSIKGSMDAANFDKNVRQLVEGMVRDFGEDARKAITERGIAITEPAAAAPATTAAPAAEKPAPTSNAVDPVESSNSMPPVTAATPAMPSLEELQAFVQEKQFPAEQLAAMSNDELLARYAARNDPPEAAAATTAPLPGAVAEAVAEPRSRTAADLTPEELSKLKAFDLTDEIIRGLKGSALEDTLTDIAKEEKRIGMTVEASRAAELNAAGITSDAVDGPNKDAVAAAAADDGTADAPATQEMTPAEIRYMQARARYMAGPTAPGPSVSSPIAGLVGDGAEVREARRPPTVDPLAGLRNGATPVPPDYITKPPANPADFTSAGDWLGAGLMDLTATRDAFPVGERGLPPGLQIDLAQYPAALPAERKVPPLVVDPAALTDQTRVQVDMGPELKPSPREVIPEGPIEVSALSSEARIREMKAAEQAAAEQAAAEKPKPATTLTERLGMNPAMDFGDTALAQGAYRAIPTIAKYGYRFALAGATIAAANEARKYFFPGEQQEDPFSEENMKKVREGLLSPDNPFAQPK